jgi:catabolite regulation protein CreA
MSNIYTNHKAKLSTTNLTTIYTVPAEKAAIIKSIRVANEDTSNISVTLVDTGSISYTIEKDRTIQAKRSQEILATGNMAQDTSDSSVAAPAPLIAKESEIIKAQAENANDLSIIISVLEISSR